MSDASLTPYPPSPDDNEISVSELLLKLWTKRGLIVFLPLIFAGIAVVSLLIGKTIEKNEISFFIELNGITLSKTVTPNKRDSEEGTRPSARASGINNTYGSGGTIVSRYPNGTVFSPQDLTNPTVIALLAAETGLKAQDLARHIDVQFGTPVSNGVLEEYKLALSANSKASAQDLAKLNERYDLKLNAAAKRGLKIMVDYASLETSKHEGAKIAVLLPKLWNQVYTSQFTTQMSSDIASLRWTEREFDLTSAIGLQEADVQLRNLKRGVKLITEDDRLRGIKSADGILAADISGQIDDFRSIFFDPLFLGAFRKSDTLARVYTQDLQFGISELDREIEELNNRLKDIRDFQNGVQSAPNRDRTDSPQLDGDALSAVVNLAEQAALSSYLQNSLDLRYDLIKQLAAATTRLERINLDTSDAQIDDSFVELAMTRYQSITRNYADILRKSQAILIAKTPSFYSVVTQPDTEGEMVSQRDLLLIALAIAMGGVFAIIAALVWPQRTDY